jgi:hypothetical protein
MSSKVPAARADTMFSPGAVMSGFNAYGPVLSVAITGPRLEKLLTLSVRPTEPTARADGADPRRLDRAGERAGVPGGRDEQGTGPGGEHLHRPVPAGRHRHPPVHRG